MSKLLLCGLMSWLILNSATPTRADDAEDKAVAFVKGLGGKVIRDEKLPGKPVVGLDLEKTAATDAGLKEIAKLTTLTTLNLRDTQVTDAGLKEFAPLKNLANLYLFGTQVTDAGLKELAPLTNLTNLNLFGTAVTGAGLKELATLKSLTTLNLSDSAVTDAGLKELQKALPKCKIERSDAFRETTATVQCSGSRESSRCARKHSRWDEATTGAAPVSNT